MFEGPTTTQRRSERKPAQIIVSVVLEEAKVQRLATAVDLSQHGVRLETDLSLAPGQRVGLLLGDSLDYVIRARVVWLGRSDSMQAGEAGLEFLKPLPDPA